MTEAPLVDWDEATYAEVAHEALGSGSCLHLTWNGEPYLKKPPLLFWMVIGSFKTFGESAWAARLPSVLAGVGTLILLYFAAAGVAGRLAGVFSGLLPLTFYFFIARGGRECATDAPLVFFTTLAIFALVRARTDRRWIPLVGVAVGLAILSKGLAGLIPLGVMMLTMLLVPGFGTVGMAGAVTITAIAGLVVAPWLIYEAATDWRMLWDVFIKQETLFRVASHVEIERQAAAATLPTYLREVRYLWVVALPLGGLAAAAIERGGRLSLSRLHPAVLVWMLWLGLGLGAACAVQTKLGWYILPALPPTALLCGSILGASFHGGVNARGYAPALGALALVILGVELPEHWRALDYAFHQERERSRPMYLLGMRARAIAAARGDEELFFAGVELPTLVYYSGVRSSFATVPAPGFPDLAYEEVVLRESDGSLATVGNLGDEWNVSGPADERDATATTRGVCPAPAGNSPPAGLRLLADTQ